MGYKSRSRYDLAELSLSLPYLEVKAYTVLALFRADKDYTVLASFRADKAYTVLASFKVDKAYINRPMKQ